MEKLFHTTVSLIAIAAIEDTRPSVAKMTLKISFDELKQQSLDITDWTCYKSAISSLKVTCPRLKLSQVSVVYLLLFYLVTAICCITDLAYPQYVTSAFW